MVENIVSAMGDVDDGVIIRFDRFLDEVTPPHHLPVILRCRKQDMQTVPAHEGIIEVTDGHPVRIRCVNASVPGSGNPTVGNRDVLDFKRITLKQFIRKSAFLTVIDEDDPHIIEINVPLQGYHVKEWLAHGPWTLVVCEDQIEDLARINPSNLHLARVTQHRQFTLLSGFPKSPG